MEDERGVLHGRFEHTLHMAENSWTAQQYFAFVIINDNNKS